MLYQSRARTKMLVALLSMVLAVATSAPLEPKNTVTPTAQRVVLQPTADYLAKASTKDHATVSTSGKRIEVQSSPDLPPGISRRWCFQDDGAQVNGTKDASTKQCGCVYEARGPGPNGFRCVVSFGYSHPMIEFDEDVRAPTCTEGLKPFSCAEFLKYGCANPSNARCSESPEAPYKNGGHGLEISCNGDGGGAIGYNYQPGLTCPPAPPPPAPPAASCFAKDSTNVCLLSTPIAPEAAYAQCFLGAEPTDASLVPMAKLSAGDLVLTSSATSSYVLANQHKTFDAVNEMLTLHTESGALSLTPDHGIFIDGALVSAAEAKVGSILSNGVVTRITTSQGAIINPVTASGTILASDSGAPVLAASHPIWIAPLVLESSVARVAINAGVFLAGDVDSIAASVVGVLVKIAATLGVVGLARQLYRVKA